MTIDMASSIAIAQMQNSTPPISLDQLARKVTAAIGKLGNQKKLNAK
ncbi:MAG TPA: hypothetical protein VF481_10140 [Novosphingobium sp.]